MNEHRSINQKEFFSLVNCAEDYGFKDDILMYSLWDFAKPVSIEQIKDFSKELGKQEGYGEQDEIAAIERLTEWFNEHKHRG